MKKTEQNKFDFLLPKQAGGAWGFPPEGAFKLWVSRWGGVVDMIWYYPPECAYMTIGGSFVIWGGVKRRCVGMCDVGLLYRFIYFFVDMGKVLHLCCQYKKEYYICTDIFYE